MATACETGFPMGWIDRAAAPAFFDGHTAIFHGRTEVILPTLGDCDLVATDPPYGIGESGRKNRSRGTSSAKWKRGRPRADYGDYSWDKAPPTWLVQHAIGKAPMAAVFGGNFFILPPATPWVIWDKMNGACDFADAELCWTNFGGAVRIIRNRWNGFIREGKEERCHPTQKPINVCREIIALALKKNPAIRTVLDPWCGSGTFLVAAREAGLFAVGIDMEKTYIGHAAKRCEAVAFGRGPQALPLPRERDSGKPA